MPSKAIGGFEKMPKKGRRFDEAYIHQENKKRASAQRRAQKRAHSSVVIKKDKQSDDIPLEFEDHDYDDEY